MRKISLFVLLCCSMFFYSNAQQITNKNTSAPLFYEKVYLHTDRDVYTQGEDIWFKAYLVDARTNKAINYSHNLYVELISPGLKIITMHVLRMEQGLGNGDFKLADTLSAGTYRLRAYTNWMRNFGDNFVFEKNITVVNTAGKQATAIVINRAIKKTKKKPLPLTKQDTLPAGPLVRFFPEGGSLVNDVTSIVAVKAEDEQGKGIAATGQVLASSNRVVGKFVCDSLGFGSFTLEPDETQQYHATVTIKGKPYDFKINDALTKGFTLGANSVSPFIVADINCNTFSLSESGGTNLVIVGSHAGRMLYKEQIRIQSKNILLQIPDANFPEGIAKVTLFDEHAKPLGERLVYVHHANGPKLIVTTDSVSYHSKQKVTVKIKVSDSTKTSLSLAAVDAGIAPVQPENILSYLELRSEIKGQIEHTERYFDTTNVNRYKQLDLLLLTQGWRNFIWKDIEDSKFKQQYDVEQALTITGRVRGVWLNKNVSQLNITMFAPKATGDKLFTAISDSAGRFRIDGAILYGYQYLNLTSRKATGIKYDGRSRGKTGGWIQVDSLYQDMLKIDESRNSTDEVTLKTDSLIMREQAKQKFSFTGINKLNTVQIKNYTNVLPPEIYPITSTEQKDYGTLGQYVIYMIPGAAWKLMGGANPDPSKSVPETPPEIEVDKRRLHVYGSYTNGTKIPWDYFQIDDDYWGLPMDRVLKVMINKRQNAYRINYTVEVLMRPGALEVKDTFDNTLADVVGYTQARVFYSPKYIAKNDKPDYRTTIHWEPNITTDEKGEATVSYYNADPKSKIQLIVQGITDNGIPVVATTKYAIK